MIRSPFGWGVPAGRPSWPARAPPAGPADPAVAARRRRLPFTDLFSPVSGAEYAADGRGCQHDLGAPRPPRLRRRLLQLTGPAQARLLRASSSDRREAP